MSSKLVSSLGYRFKRVVKCFHEDWLDSLYRVHLVINSSKFLDDDQKDLIKLHTRALLVHNRKCNPNFWITCLPYVLRKQKNGNYYMDYIILVKVDPINFSENGIDVKVDCEKVLESANFDDVCLVTDGDSTASVDSDSDSDFEEKVDFHITVTDGDSAEFEDSDNINSQWIYFKNSCFVFPCLRSFREFYTQVLMFMLQNPLVEYT